MSEIRIKHVDPPYPFEAYAHVIEPIPAEDGGGFLITVPDLPGCMSDGKAEVQAVLNGRDAFSAWVSAVVDMGDPIPAPAFRHDAGTAGASRKFVTRVPRSVHAQLAARAKRGVSLNTLVLTFIAEGLGRRDIQA